MRISARLLLAFLILVIFAVPKTPAFAQTSQQSNATNVQTATTNTTNNFLMPNVDPNIPRNHHEYTQIVAIDVLSTIMCELTGIDPTNPRLPCLGVNPTTGIISMPPINSTQTFGQAASAQPAAGGAIGLMAGYIADLYVPAVSSTQYVHYLASNFGLAKPAYAAGQNSDCTKSTLGYGFCGLTPVLKLWLLDRDFAYALLTILFIVIGIGVMLRFRVDPRTVMTLQNQIPRVIIAILLITFSYAIAGIMIDLMWTATFAGINLITNTQNTQVAVSCKPTKIETLSQAADTSLLQDPFSFADLIFIRDCNGTVHSGIFGVASGVSNAFNDIIVQVLQNVLGVGGCDLNPFNFNFGGCIVDFFLWIARQLVKLIVIIALLVALFRLFFQLIKAYVTFLIFVILGPLWIVFGLIPGRPLGFEKWLRIVFANLAVFPVVALLIVLARVIVDAASTGATTAGGGNPQQVFIPPLVGNPNASHFVYLLALGTILIAPSIPDQIKDRLKATSQGKLGATVAAGIGVAATAATAPGRKIWESGNRRNSVTGAPEGSIAILRQNLAEKIPGVRKYQTWRRTQRANARARYEGGTPSQGGAGGTTPQRRRPWRRNKGGGGNSSGGPQTPPQPQGGTPT